MVSLRMVQQFDATPETVFAAFTEPEAMRVWWGDNVTFDIDLRPGGRWTIVRRADDTVYTATGEYLLVEPPHRLSYSYAMPQFSPNSDIVTIEIAAEGTGSIMTFTQSGEDIAHELSDTAAGEISASQEGWQQGFDLMATAWAK